MAHTNTKDLFPIFRNRPSLVYLDHAATAQKPLPVIERIARFYAEENANIHRGAYPLSAEAESAYEDARAAVRDWIDAEDAQEIVFTKSSTEAINLLARSLGCTLSPGDRIVTTELEHSSNYFPWLQLRQERGVRVLCAEAEPDGSLKTESVLRLLDSRTRILAITAMSNVNGYRPDLSPLISAAHDAGALVYVDATQLAAHERLSVRRLQCDFLSFSAHKIYGPMGLGILYGRKDLLEALPPFLYGGGMVMKGTGDEWTYLRGHLAFEAGTQDIAAAVGLKSALDFLGEHDFSALTRMESVLASGIRSRIGELKHIHVIPGPLESPIFLIAGDHMGAYDIGTFLGLRDIAVRTGAHCAYPLMERMGMTTSCRISLGCYCDESDVERLMEALSILDRF